MAKLSPIFVVVVVVVVRTPRLYPRHIADGSTRQIWCLLVGWLVFKNCRSPKKRQADRQQTPPHNKNTRRLV
ncbi:hypothetical protein B0T17DRAFT_532330 [Bombardia bombarda]|uniref:Secreted protein n=1 Tax=Bombardia bombarda TaxID=252184 RepID=A0AA40C5R1_9PEZI|nr:hypothetical protein B0T17DRAFT_532330 [Bombardia bombarda]